MLAGKRRVVRWKITVTKTSEKQKQNKGGEHQKMPMPAIRVTLADCHILFMVARIVESLTMIV